MTESRKWLIAIFMFVTYALFAMAWKTGDWYITHLNFSSMDLAFLTNAISFAKIIGSILTAYFIMRFGNRNLFTYATLLAALSYFIAFSSSWSTIFQLRFITGLGGALILVNMSPLASRLFEGKTLVLVNGLNSVAFNVGLALSLSFAAPIQANPALFLKLYGVILLLISIVWIFITKDLGGHTPQSIEKDKSYTFLQGLKERFNLSFTFAYSGLLSFYIISFTFMDPASIKWVIYAGILGAFMGTWNAQKIKNKFLLTRFSALVQLLSAILFLSFYNSPFGKLFGLILGFFIFFPMPAFITLAFIRKNINPRKIAVSFSIFWSMSYLISTVLVPLYSKVASVSESYGFIFLVIIEGFFFLGTNLFMKNEFEQ